MGDLTVETCVSAQEALALLQTRQFDVVVSDYQMPGMDGIDFLKVHRGRGDLTPFILFTGKGREEVAVEAINNGADFYLQKGGDFRGQFSELVNMMKQAVQRRRSDQALRESEERYRQLFDNIGVGVAVLEATEDGRDFIFRDLNRGAQNIEKARKEEIIGRKVTEVFPGVDEIGILGVFRRVHQTGNPEYYPLSFYQDDRIVSYRENYVYRLPSGEVVAVYEDVADTREMNAKARLSEEKFMTLFQSALDSIFIHDFEGNILEVNPATVRALGYSRDELLKMNLRDIEPPQSAEMVTSRMESLIQSGEAVFEVAQIAKDGSIRPIEVATRVVTIGGEQLVVSFARNIADRKRAEQSLKESEANYLALMNNTDDLIWSIDRDYRLISGNSVFNERVKRKLGKPIEKGENVLEPAAELEVIQQWKSYYDRALQSEHFRIESFSQTVPEPYFLEYVFNPIQNEKGEVSGVIVSGRDITDRKKMEEALRQTNIKLNLLSSITRHDLLNQLSAVSGYVVLAREKVRSPEAKSLLAKADQASSNMAHLLSFTKEYERLGKAEPVWMSLSQVSSQGVRDVEHQGMELKVDLGSYEVYADRLLERAFHNLAINSVKHSVKGKKMEVSCEEGPEGLVIVFHDDGVGISAMRKEEIFESERGHRGLFLVRSILDITGIKIKENGVEGQGARFEILVPNGRYRPSSV